MSRELFDAVQQAMKDRAPAKRKPGRVGSKFLLSGLLRCGVCGRPYTGQGAKSGQFAYYICGTLYREGAGTCEARYLNAPRVEDFVVEKIRERILTEETITELVTLGACPRKTLFVIMLTTSEHIGKQCNANRTIVQCALCTSLVSENTQTHS